MKLNRLILVSSLAFSSWFLASCASATNPNPLEASPNTQTFEPTATPFDIPNQPLPPPPIEASPTLPGPNSFIDIVPTDSPDVLATQIEPTKVSNILTAQADTTKQAENWNSLTPGLDESMVTFETQNGVCGATLIEKIDIQVPDGIKPMTLGLYETASHCMMDNDTQVDVVARGTPVSLIQTKYTESRVLIPGWVVGWNSDNTSTDPLEQNAFIGILAKKEDMDVIPATGKNLLAPFYWNPQQNCYIAGIPFNATNLRVIDGFTIYPTPDSTKDGHGTVAGQTIIADSGLSGSVFECGKSPDDMKINGTVQAKDRWNPNIGYVSIHDSDTLALFEDSQTSLTEIAKEMVTEPIVIETKAP